MAAKTMDLRDKLKQLILYISSKMQTADFFGAAKLNKVLFRSEMAAYADLGLVLTGYKYQKNKFGPTLRAYPHVVEEMQRDGLIELIWRSTGAFNEQRLVPRVAPNLDFFSEGELEIIDREIRRAWDATGTQISDEEHQTAAWFATRKGENIEPALSLVEDPGNMFALSHEEEERAGVAIERFLARTAATAGH